MIWIKDESGKTSMQGEDTCHVGCEKIQGTLSNEASEMLLVNNTEIFKVRRIPNSESTSLLCIDDF